jgi:hypothetical protein
MIAHGSFLADRDSQFLGGPGIKYEEILRLGKYKVSLQMFLPSATNSRAGYGKVMVFNKHHMNWKTVLAVGRNAFYNGDLNDELFEPTNTRTADINWESYLADGRNSLVRQTAALFDVKLPVIPPEELSPPEPDDEEDESPSEKSAASASEPAVSL